MMIKEIYDKMDPVPGLSDEEFATRCYAVELYKQLFEARHLHLYSDANELGTVTEEDLLNGSRDWGQYSKDGNALFWTDDLFMRLTGEKKSACSAEKLLSMQADCLEEAAKLVIETINEVLAA